MTILCNEILLIKLERLNLLPKNGTLSVHNSSFWVSKAQQLLDVWEYGDMPPSSKLNTRGRKNMKRETKTTVRDTCVFK